MTTAVAPSMSTTSTDWPGSKLVSESRVRADQISLGELDAAAAAVDAFQDEGAPALQRLDAAAVLGALVAVAVGEGADDGDERDRHGHEHQDLGHHSPAERGRHGGEGRADGEHAELRHRGDDQGMPSPTAPMSHHTHASMLVTWSW